MSMLTAKEIEQTKYEDKFNLIGRKIIGIRWLTKEELSSAIRAYRMLKNDEDIEQLLDMYEKVAKVPY